MKFVPHDYQAYCIQYVKTHPIAALFLTMGLGKTAITLTAVNDLMLDTFDVSKVLVVAPLRVARNTWPAEVEKWEHLKFLSISVIVGDQKTRIGALNHPSLVYVINRETIKWLVEYYEKNGLRWDFDMVVIDELSSFKNHQSQRFRFLRKIRPFVKRFVGLTGTPTSNGLMDLWAEIGILDGGERLGRFIGRYREAYFKPGSMNPQTGVVFQYVPRDGAEEQIYERISDIAISMKALDYLNMPECVMASHEVEMSTQEKKLYDMLAKDLLIPLEDGDIDAANAAALSGKLLQMANGAVYDENGTARRIHDYKLEALEDLIEAANGQSVLVAYWFKHDKKRIEEHLSRLGYQTRDIKSSGDIKDWNAGKIPVALIHPASAGHGLNIQEGGHILVWFGLTWSLELYQQTNARLWRQGQTDVVTVHHIITKGTVDEDVMAALEEKDVTQEKLIAAVKARLGR
ncbi:DEAD/DEAH box helicase [Mediterraneibacter agrestimuris]|uniref:DEAD/DEAH box helicase n=1 Tax=Mediterraneibacter agrestimuris TaxID=2941333 RepID=UPI002040C2AF|nr:DEAD/DEAH box helicase [Mediterraneibacter agrestimuris]